jgi:hypothetical protein
MKKLEHHEQAAYFDWVKLKANTDDRYKCIYAIPNGAYLQGDATRRAIQMNKLKREGLKKGMLDICIPYPIPHPEEGFIFPGAYIEMKVDKNKPSEEQKEVIRLLKQFGYVVGLCYNFEEAKDFTLSYFNTK